MPETYLTPDQCKEGFLYSVDGRNCTFAIYKKTEAINESKLMQQFIDSFLYVRFKFGRQYIDREYHWDNGNPFGTVKPLKEIEKVPDEIMKGPEIELFNYLKQKMGGVCV